ncbi:MAG TPA: sigma-70 family RNA polymerase sigma factor [Pirellulales bacterium]|nr:sigma-70 family RNA polymerase sigma factor [Pirellulales bacterium]
MALEHTAETTAWTERFQRGDEHCLQEVRDDLCPRVCTILKQRFHRLGPALIEEAVAAAMWTAWRRRANFDPGRGTFHAWFYAIASGHCLDLLRKRARSMELTMAPGELERLPEARRRPAGCDGIGIDEPRGRVESCFSAPCAMVREALGSLPQSQRAVLTADGEAPNGRADTHALAVELGISDSAVRQARQRGLKRLKSELERRGIEKFLSVSHAERINCGANPRRPKRKRS